MHRMTFVRRTRLLVAAAGALVCAAGAAAQELPPHLRNLPTLPPAPHHVTPDAALFPDYYTLALQHTKTTDDPTWRPLHLATTSGHPDPAFIELPVQSQAYALPPVTRALVGARLDQELQRRHVDASRQTDIVDWRGPFVRRTDDATIANLAAEHPTSSIIALYLGHDGQGHAFITMSRRDGGKTRLAHRRIEFGQDGASLPDRLAGTLAPLLGELGIGDGRQAPALPAGVRTGCADEDWRLADLDSNASPISTACHALLMGSLLPDFITTTWTRQAPITPDRLAWLARAWVESSALADSHPAMRSVAALASFELVLDPAFHDTSALAADADPVVRPLARMFWARERASGMPTRSRDQTADRYVEDAVSGLPPFAAAVVTEHAAFDEGFRQTDLCDMQMALPWFALPAGCEPPEAGTARPTVPATRAQRQLLDAWRVAAAWNALHIEGNMRGSASALARVEQDLPPPIATHPMIREMRFSVHGTLAAAPDLATHMVQTRQAMVDGLQAIATLQHTDPYASEHRLASLKLLAAEQQDDIILQALDDDERLRSVEVAETPNPTGMPNSMAPGSLAPFLIDGKFIVARFALMRARGMLGSPGLRVPMPSAEPRAPSLANVGHLVAPLRSRATLESAIAQYPYDFESRKELAIVLLEHGDGVAAAQRVLDARPRSTQAEDALSETADLASCGDLFFYAGERDMALHYYRLANRAHLGSQADLNAGQRVAALSGDVRASRALSRSAAARYQYEWSLAAEAGDTFMLGETEAGWKLLLPRMQTSTTPALWRTALAAHRMASTPLADLRGWLTANHLEKATADGLTPADDGWLHTYATLDRLPTEADIALFPGPFERQPSRIVASGAIVIRAAIAGMPAGVRDTLDQELGHVYGSDRSVFTALQAWTLWNAGKGKDPALEQVRAIELEAGFPSVLAKAMVLAADGNRAEALRFLVAARYELARNATEGRFPDNFRTAAYHFVLATWLMTRQTGEQAYAEQGLAIARGHQAVTEYMAWPYAAEALLSRDPKAREIAACRAAVLDPGSMMLHESGLHPDPKSAACRKATTW